ncbi:hypothetical protein D3C76_1593890 [compost metagenome]
MGCVINVMHVDGHGRRIVERAQYTTDILVRAVLAPTLPQRPRRFAFEVDQVRVTLDHQHLAEVQITVYTDPQSTRGLFGQLLDMAENGLFMLQ